MRMESDTFYYEYKNTSIKMNETFTYFNTYIEETHKKCPFCAPTKSIKGFSNQNVSTADKIEIIFNNGQWKTQTLESDGTFYEKLMEWSAHHKINFS